MGSQCAACGRIGGDTWTALRFTCAPANASDGAVEDDLDDEYEDGDYDPIDLEYDEPPVSGVVPLCSWCVLVCPSCGAPVLTDPVHALLDRHRRDEIRGSRGEPIALSWAIEPCDDPGHERPAFDDAPHPAQVTPPRAPALPQPRSVPGWSSVMHEWKGLRVGDRVIVDGRKRHPGRVASIASNRLSGGVYVHVVFPDGSRVGCRPRQLQPATGV